MDVWISFVQRFLFVIVITLPFDIRDLNYDREDINTIPKSLGIKYTKFLGVGLLIVFFILEFFKDEIQYKNVFALCIVGMFSAIFLMASSEKQYKYYASFFVEGLPMIWWGLLYLVLALLS
jgi:4-hydroxybenzoate polyprenyltransferase